GAQVDLVLAPDLRRRVDERERGRPALLEIERRDAHEPMRPALRLQVSVRVVALDRQRRAAEARLVAGGHVEELAAEAPPLGPAQVHANEHLGPVRRVGPADPGRDRDDRVALVVRAGELRLEARACDLRAELGELRRDLRLERTILARERGELGDVLPARSKPTPPPEAPADA